MVLQLIVTGIILGCEYALLGVSWGVIFKVTKTFHFAHGAIYTLGGYSTLLIIDRLGVPLAVSLVLGAIAAALVGGAVEIFLYKPLRRIKATPLTILIASLGLSIIIEMLIVLLVGDGPQSVRYSPELISLGNIRLTSIQVYSVVVNLFLVGTTLFFLNKTRAGRITEAVASNPELAGIVGIDVDRIFTYALLIGSGLVGAAATLALLDRGIDPFVGTMAATVAFIAVIMGGMESLLGGALAGFILGIAINLGVLWFPSEWQYLLAFTLVIILLIIRPEGLLGKGKG